MNGLLGHLRSLTMRDIRRIFVVFALCILFLIVAYFGFFSWVNDSVPSGENLRVAQIRTGTTITSNDPVIKMELMTTKGQHEITIVLHRDWAPLGVDRFLSLVKDRYYDDNRFFRVLKVYNTNTT